MVSPESWTLVGITFAAFEVIGLLSAIKAILTARTSQGAIAWVLALVTIPVLSVPLYWIFGRAKFHGYVNARRSRDASMLGIYKEAIDQIRPYRVEMRDEFADGRVLEKLTQLPFFRGNSTSLLIDGEATFREMFAVIDSAERYVLAEFFIIHDDEIGRKFSRKLIDAANRGCRVFMLYDEVGCNKLPRPFVFNLQANGVKVTPMNTTRGFFNRFQINFRNHRKTIVVDGRSALIGGLNIGDEYNHKHKRLTPWRDTHIRFDGPAVLSAQAAFVEDWSWATGALPELPWEPQPSETADRMILVLPSGPSDENDTCGLFFTHAIHSAKTRIWIASPYFVPDEGIVTALKLAAMKGVDVRIIIPGLPDKWIVKQAAYTYVEAVMACGARVYEYGDGFMHQKVMLVDDDASVIGTANFDNRSFRLNFEISVLTLHKDFASSVERMLVADLERSTEMDAQQLAQKGLFFRITSRAARLLAPIL